MPLTFAFIFLPLILILCPQVMMDISYHHIAEKQINIQNTQHIMKIEQVRLTLTKYTTQLVYETSFCVTQQNFKVFANLLGYRIVFFCTLHKKEIRTASCRADDNGVHIRKGTGKKIFKVAFDETKIKVNSARIFQVDASGSLYVNKREGATYKKINIESDDVFELF